MHKICIGRSHFDQICVQKSYYFCQYVQINSFEKVTGKKVNHKLVDRREGDITAAYADTNFANNELGWKAELSLDEALLSAWKWQETL